MSEINVYFNQDKKMWEAEFIDIGIRLTVNAETETAVMNKLKNVLTNAKVINGSK